MLLVSMSRELLLTGCLCVQEGKAETKKGVLDVALSSEGDLLLQNLPYSTVQGTCSIRRGRMYDVSP